MSGTVLIAGGGTGGHVFPTLAVAQALRAARPDVGIEFVGTARGLESRLVPAEGWPLHLVDVLGLQGPRLSSRTARVPVALARSAARVVRLIRERGVVAAAVFGGYVSLPLAIAAWRTGTPYVVHEQNAIPGRANRLAARRAAAVAVTFPSSLRRVRARQVVLTGNPVRTALAGVDRAGLRAEALAAFGLDPGRRTLLVFGGSQGARRINQAIVGTVGRWRHPERLQILHAAGRGEYEATVAAWERAAEAGAGGRDEGDSGGRGGGGMPLVNCLDFVDRMDLAYAAADVVVCRAGASSIAELTVLGLPGVLVPYPHAADDHQTVNAADLSATGAATVVSDGALDAGALVGRAEPLLLDDARRSTMAAAARAFGRPHAAARVALLVLAAAGLRPADPIPTRGPSGGPP